MKREQRLRTSADFVRVREHAGRGWPHPFVVLYVATNDLGLSRVGITVSSRVGKAVVRNRVRRRIREALRVRLPQLRPGVDLVFVARPASKDATWIDLNRALDVLLKRAGLERDATKAASACV